MEELRNLALQLGKMGLLKVTLEADLKKFLELKKSVQEYMATASPVSKQYDEINGGLEFFIALYGVKMLIVCRNARLETVS